MMLPTPAFAAPCPSASSVAITCSPVTCPYSDTMVTLATACSTNLTGVTLSYTINGAAAVSAACPEPGKTVRVKTSVEQYLRVCRYDGPELTITCAPVQEGRHSI